MEQRDTPGLGRIALGPREGSSCRAATSTPMGCIALVGRFPGVSSAARDSTPGYSLSARRAEMKKDTGHHQYAEILWDAYRTDHEELVCVFTSPVREHRLVLPVNTDHS